MPLQHSASKEALASNMRVLHSEIGKSPHVQSRAQAVAIALETQRRARQGKAQGGVAMEGFAFGGGPAPWFVRNEARNLGHIGPIHSIVPGRTDNHSMRVPSGAYVIPAQAVSHLGQNNTNSGMAVLSHMFGPSGPYGMGRSLPIRHGAGAPRPPRQMAVSSGGARESAVGSPVDIMAAGGEFVVPPHVVQAIGGGDLKRGHAVLDHWVMRIKRDHIKTLKGLAPPAKS